MTDPKLTPREPTNTQVFAVKDAVFKHRQYWLSNEEATDAIRAMHDAAPTVEAEPAALPERWVIVRQTALDVGYGDDVRTGGKPELGYALIRDAATFTSEHAALAAIRSGSKPLPLGWVVMRLSRLLPDLYTHPAAPQPAALPELRGIRVCGKCSMQLFGPWSEHQCLGAHIVRYEPPETQGPTWLPTSQPAARRADGMPASADERHLRRLLAARVGMPHTYFDDGEAQGQEHGITIDFMRQPVADIDAMLRALNVARYECAAPPPAALPESADKLREALQALVNSIDNNTGALPSSDVYERALDEARAALKGKQ